MTETEMLISDYLKVIHTAYECACDIIRSNGFSNESDAIDSGALSRSDSLMWCVYKGIEYDFERKLYDLCGEDYVDIKRFDGEDNDG